jgi:hypothetical protein
MEATKPLQIKLFHETIEDAITTDVLAAGGYKKVGHSLRTDLSPEHAAAWLRACLNVERAEKLSPGHVLHIKRIAKQHNSHATIDYESQQLSYRVEWVNPVDELEQIERENNEMLRVILKRTERAEQLRSVQLVRDTRGGR